jgi:competence protein ComEC
MDIIIISKNPKLKMEQLNATFNCKQYVFDASNSLYKIEKWKRQCDSLKLIYYVVPEQGAFVCDINH